MAGQSVFRHDLPVLRMNFDTALLPPSSASAAPRLCNCCQRRQACSTQTFINDYKLCAPKLCSTTAILPPQQLSSSPAADGSMVLYSSPDRTGAAVR